MLFFLSKRVTLLDTSSESELKRKERLLKDAGIETNSWTTDSQPVIGCGAHMKPGDWSGEGLSMENKDNSRTIYHLEVRERDKMRAMALMMRADDF